MTFAAAEPSVLAGKVPGELVNLIDTNLNGTINTLYFAKKHQAAIIFLSTSRVYPYDTLANANLVESSKRFNLSNNQINLINEINDIFIPTQIRFFNVINDQEYYWKTPNKFSQYDNLELNRELWIKNTVDKNIPVLGICLGSQLIAKTFGASVYPGPKKEIGFYHDLKVENNSTLFSGLKNPFSVFHWHGDTFDLPENAIRLAHSKNYPNQAFQIGSAVGLQFHMEVNEEMINLWLDKTQEKLELIPYIDPKQIRSDISENISIVKNNMDNFYTNFKSLFHL